jgi:quercetin dioxygenase-like cupin family protein
MPPGGAYALRAGEAELRWMGETSTFFLATGAQTGESFALVDERAMDGEAVPLHRHDDVESFYVIEGEVTFFLGEDAGVTGGAGTFVHVPPGVVHGFRVASRQARYLILTTPRHGEFYKAITLASREGGLPPLESIDGAQIRAAAVEYEIEFVGPLPDA